MSAARHLHLDNFLNEEAQGSEYVLTSPRSLQACKILGFKPVELLPQNLEEYEEELSGAPITEIYEKYENDENARLGKLSSARTLWQELKYESSGPATGSNIQKNNGRRNPHRKRNKRKKRPMGGHFRSDENLRRRASPTLEVEDYEEASDPECNESQIAPRYDRPKSAGNIYKMRSYSAQTLPTSAVDLIKGRYGNISDQRNDIPENDRKILHLMTARRLLERQMEEEAEKYRLAWEEQNRQRQKEQELANAQHQAQVTSRRERENAENERRLAEIERHFMHNQRVLWQTIMEKQQRAQQLLKDIQQAKRDQIMQKQKEDELKKSAQEGELRKREEEEEQYRHKIKQITERKMKQAEDKKKILEEEYRQKIMESNIEEQQKREMMLRHLSEETERTIQYMSRAIKEREERVESNYRNIQKQRDENIKQRQEAYDGRRRAACRIRSELDIGMAKLRNEVRKLQLMSQQKAEEQVRKAKQRKRDELRQERENREKRHQMQFTNVQIEAAIAEQALRQQISNKYNRAEKLMQEKQNNIQEARKIASTTARLRQNIKTGLSPETFDKKTVRADLEIRLSSRASTPKLVQRSHIILG